MYDEGHLTQITETEISIPLKFDNPYISSPLRFSVLTCGTFVLCLSMGILSLVLHYFVPLGNFLMLMSLLLALTLPVFIRGLHTGPWQLHINQEGIFYCYVLPIFIKWDEIIAFVPSTSMGTGTPTLSIIIKDEMAIFDRFLEVHAIRGWENSYYQLMNRFSIWLRRHVYHYHSSVFLSQQLLSLSIDDLLMMIQERFANELYEHNITTLN